jgi:hypothetical protein
VHREQNSDCDYCHRRGKAHSRTRAKTDKYLRHLARLHGVFTGIWWRRWRLWPLRISECFPVNRTVIRRTATQTFVPVSIIRPRFESDTSQIKLQTLVALLNLVSSWWSEEQHGEGNVRVIGGMKLQQKRKREKWEDTEERKECKLGRSEEKYNETLGGTIVMETKKVKKQMKRND